MFTKGQLLCTCWSLQNINSNVNMTIHKDITTHVSALIKPFKHSIFSHFVNEPDKNYYLMVTLWGYQISLVYKMAKYM